MGRVFASGLGGFQKSPPLPCSGKYSTSMPCWSRMCSDISCPVQKQLHTDTRRPGGVFFQRAAAPSD
eukprot:951603-Prorocentrum_lima.AAC.1